MRIFVFAMFICAGCRVPAAFAWGDIGHRVICQIAYEELKPEIKARLDALIAIDPKFRTFADPCTAPDHCSNSYRSRASQDSWREDRSNP